MAAGVSMMLIRTLQAVHELAFELEGDIITQGSSNFPTLHSPTLDWASFFGVSGDPLPGAVNPVGPGFTASGFEPDFKTTTGRGGVTFNTSDDTTFTTGSKDTLPISTGWQCAQSNNVLSKDDIMNAYAVAYTVPPSGSVGNPGDQIIYFALERNANTGDANVGFWFLQDNVDCSSSGGAVSFAGHHTDGDILVVSAFTKGGDVSTIDVFRWTSPTPGIGLGDNGTLVAVPQGHGTDCRLGTVGAGDGSCAASNTDGSDPNLPNIVNGTGGTITAPWLTAAKTLGVGHSLPTGQFFEGGLNLTATGLGGHCFNVFIGDTRSSQSTTATIFDFARGRLGECTSTTTTTPSITGTTTVIPAQGSPALTVTDDALVTVTGIPSFTGSVTFHLCGPFALASATLCDTGGVDAGSGTVTASGQHVVSNTMTITEVGRYCFRADFAETSSAGVPPSSDSRASECFSIQPRTPDLTTNAVAATVDFGSAVADNATLTGTAKHQGTNGPAGSTDGSINASNTANAGGTITFTLVHAGAPNTCGAAATGTGTNPQTRAVNGDGTYGPVSFTPDAPGTYYWIASYDGDTPNTTSKSDNLSCNLDREKVVVRQIPTSITSGPSAIPNDTATITSSVAGNNLGTGGTVVFKLFGPAGGSTAAQNCAANSGTVGTGGLLYTQTFTNQGGQHTIGPLTTTNTTVSVNVDQTVYWRVTYAPSAQDTAHTGIQSACVENTSFTFAGDAGPGSNFP